MHSYGTELDFSNLPKARREEGMDGFSSPGPVAVEYSPVNSGRFPKQNLVLPAIDYSDVVALNERTNERTNK
jgi:hypothetical protein